MTAEDRSAQGRSNRRQGDQHNRNVVAYLRRWFPDARRQLHSLSGDIEGTGPLLFECKYTGWQAIPAAVDQAQGDAKRRGLARGVVIKKRQGISNIGKAFWISTVEQEIAAAVRLIELEQEVLQLRRQLAAAGTTAVVSTGPGGVTSAGGGGATITPGSNGRPTMRAGGGTGSTAARPGAGGGGGAVPVTFKPPARPQHPEGLPF